MFRISSFLLQSNASWLLASDKIYAVMTIILLILGGMVVLLVRTDRKLKSAESRMNEIEQLAKQVNK